MEARIGEQVYRMGSKAEMAALARAMEAAGVERVDVYVDGARFTSIDIDKARRSAGLIREIG